MTTTAARVQQLQDFGVPEDKARAAVAELQRAKRFGQDLVVGGMFSLADDMPDTDHAVHPLLVAGQLAAMTAHPGAGKSTVCIGIAFAYVLHKKMGSLDPRGDGLVYYISAEDVAGTRLRAFAEAIRHELNIDERAAVDERLRWMHVNAQVRPELIVEAINEDAEGRPVALIFVDTGPATFAGEEENSNTDQQAHAMAWRRGTELPGSPCVVVMGHPPKGAGADALVPRGGSAYLGSLDSNLTIWKDDDVVTVSHTKLRSEHFEPVKFRLEPVPIVLESGANVSVPVAVAVTDEAADAIDLQIGARRRAILLTLFDANEPLSGREIARRATGGEGKKSTVMRDILAMTAGRKALVEKGALTDRFGLTAEGRRAGAALREREARAYRTESNGA